MDTRHPPAEIRVDAELVQRLLESQHPAFLGGEVTLVDEGWDNFTFRVAREHAVRLPRRQAAVQLIRNEQRWLPVVAPWLAFAVPTPIGVGEP
jgi:aminoglycoside phosphotransferase (APT) family kinase protein